MYDKDQLLSELDHFELLKFVLRIEFKKKLSKILKLDFLFRTAIEVNCDLSEQPRVRHYLNLDAIRQQVDSGKIKSRAYLQKEFMSSVDKYVQSLPKKGYLREIAQKIQSDAKESLAKRRERD